MKRRSSGPLGHSTRGSKPHREKTSGKKGFKPDPRRQLLYAAVTVAAILGGYFGAPLLQAHLDSAPGGLRGGEQMPPAAQRQPWYRSQPLPPTLIKAPSAPIFPDHPSEERREEPLRPYEEALPHEIYEPKVSPVAIPVPTIPPSVDLPAWQRFAPPIPDTGGRPMIALIIDDIGVDQRHSAQAIHLKGPLTLSFLAYAKALDRQTAAARAAGHELLLHVSMEPGNDHLDPGPNALTVELNAQELLRRLRWGLQRFSGYVGINNHMGSRFTADPAGMRVVMQELKKRGLLFLDSRTTTRTVGAALARRIGVPYAERNVFLDNINDTAAVLARLAEVENLARRKGYVVAIGHPREATLHALSIWLPNIEKRGFVLVPLSAVVHVGSLSG